MFHDKYGHKLTAKQAVPKITNRIYNIWVDFELLVLRLVGLVPFHCFRRWCYRLAGMKIGHGSAIHIGANFFQPKNIIIGEDTVIGYRCFMDGRAAITVGNHVDIASEVMIYNAQHDIDHPDFVAIEKPVIIGDFVFIGPRAMIMPGVKIGRGAVVAGGAVVTKDVPDAWVVGGVPAVKIRERKIKNFTYRLGRARMFQ